jgi:putative toxin-antitoxin system antitoxin component (TIGR02293 family)
MKAQASKRSAKSALPRSRSAKLSNHPTGSFAKTLELIRQGYAKRSVAKLAAQLQVTQEQLLHAVGLSPRTIRGRKDRLTSLETDRLVRVEQVFQKAFEVLGTEAASWMSQPAYAFGGIKPLDMLDTEVGTREVFNLLGSIEWGQYY